MGTHSRHFLCTLAGRQRRRFPYRGRRGLLSLSHSARAAEFRMSRLWDLRQLCGRRQSQHQDLHRAIPCEPADQSRMGAASCRGAQTLSRGLRSEGRRRPHSDHRLCCIASRWRLVADADQQRPNQSSPCQHRLQRCRWGRQGLLRAHLVDDIWQRAVPVEVGWSQRSSRPRSTSSDTSTPGRNEVHSPAQSLGYGAAGKSGSVVCGPKSVSK